MKSWVAVAWVLTCFIGCRQDELAPGDELYRRWRLVKTQYATSGQTVDISNTEWSITTFRVDGTIVYGANGRYTACCSPYRFKRKGTTLDLVNVGAIPLPETDNPESCNLVDCIDYGSSWQILTLTAQSLTIRTNYGVNMYQAYN